MRLSSHLVQVEEHCSVRLLGDDGTEGLDVRLHADQQLVTECKLCLDNAVDSLRDNTLHHHYIIISALIAERQHIITSH